MSSAVSPNPAGERVVRHMDYYITTGDVVFRVENILFRVHRYFFTRDSAFFRDKLPHPPPPGEFTKGSSDGNPFVLEDTLKIDFERLLWVFYNPLYSIYEGSVEEWSSILKLAHQWEFVEVKAFALRELERHEIPALQKIILYHTHDINRNLLQAAYVAITVRDEPIAIEEGRILGLETALLFARAREIARAPVFGGKRSGNTRSPINLAGTELDSLVKELFQLSLPDAPVERPPSPETPTGRGTPTGGRKTPQIGIQTNGAGSPSPNSHRGGSVPRTGSTATHMERPTATAMAAGAADEAASTPPPRPRPTQDAGAVGRAHEGAGTLSGIPNGPELKGKESAAAEASLDSVMHLDISKRDFMKKVVLDEHRSEPAVTQARANIVETKETSEAQGAPSTSKSVLDKKGQGPARKSETAEQGSPSSTARPERARVQSEQLATTTSVEETRSSRARSRTAEPTKKEQLQISTTGSGPELPKRDTTPTPTRESSSSSAAHAHRPVQHKHQQSVPTPVTTSRLLGFVSNFIGGGGDPGYESSARESEDDTPMAGAYPRGGKSHQERERAEAEARANVQEATRLRLEAEAAEARADAEEKVRKDAEEKARKAEAMARKEEEDKARKEEEDKARKAEEDKARKEEEDNARKETNRAKTKKVGKKATQAAAKAKRGAKAKAEAEVEPKTEAEAKVDPNLQAESEAEKAKREAEAEENAEEEPHAQAVDATLEAEAKAEEAPIKAQEEAEANDKAPEEAAADEAAEREANAKAAEEAKLVADAEAKSEAEKAEQEAIAKAEAAAAEERERERLEQEKEMAELRAKQVEEQIAKRRAEDKAARLATNSSASSGSMSPRTSGNSWFSFSKVTQAASIVSAIVAPGSTDESRPPSKLTGTGNSELWSRRPIQVRSPAAEPSPRSATATGNSELWSRRPIQVHSPAAEPSPRSATAPRGSTSATFRSSLSSSSATSDTAAGSSASVVSSGTTVVSRESSTTKDKQEGAVGKGKGNQDQTAPGTPAASSAGQVGDNETKAQPAEAITNKQRTPDAAETSQASDGTAQSPVPDALGEKSTSSALISSEVEITQAHETTPSIAVAAEPEPHNNSEAPLPSPADSAPPVPEKDTAVAKKPSPTSEETSISRSQSADPATSKAVDADKSGETLERSSETEAAATAKGDNLEPGAAGDDPIPPPGADDNHTVGEGSAATQSRDAKPDGPAKLRVQTDRIRQLSTGSTMMSSVLETPADSAVSSAAEPDEEGGPGSLAVTPGKSKKKKKKPKKKPAAEKNSPHPPPSGAAANDADNSTEQDPVPSKPVPSAPVDAPEDDGVLVERVDSSGDDSGVIVKAPEAQPEQVGDTASGEDWEFDN